MIYLNNNKKLTGGSYTFDGKVKAISNNAINKDVIVITKFVAKEIYFDMTAKEIEDGFVLSFRDVKNQNEATITSLNAEKASLEKQVKTLTESNEDKDEEIAVLNNQIVNLQALISQLQTTNALNIETINSLNAQITNLNAQISDLTMQLQNNSSNVIALQNRIAELEKSIAYYEQYIANLENGE